MNEYGNLLIHRLESIVVLVAMILISWSLTCEKVIYKV